MKNLVFIQVLITIMFTNSKVIQLENIKIGSIQKIKLDCEFSKGFIWEVVSHNFITIMSNSDIHLKNNKSHEVSLIQRKMSTKTKTGGHNDCWLIFKVNKPRNENRKNYIKLVYIQPFDRRKSKKKQIVKWKLE